MEEIVMNNQDLYFKSEAARYIFGLTELVGKAQLNLLGIGYDHYRSEKLAKNWYEYVKQVIEDSEYTDLVGAMGILETLYEGMIRKI